LLIVCPSHCLLRISVVLAMSWLNLGIPMASFWLHQLLFIDRA